MKISNIEQYKRNPLFIANEWLLAQYHMTFQPAWVFGAQRTQGTWGYSLCAQAGGSEDCWLHWMSCVSEHVSPEIASLTEFLSTLLTFMWLPPTVDQHMCSDVTWCCAGESTLLTCIRIASTVCEHVRSEVTGWSAGVNTLVTFVWFLSSMCKHVFIEISRLFAGLRTLFTLVWFPSSMCKQVNF